MFCDITIRKSIKILLLLCTASDSALDSVNIAEMLSVQLNSATDEWVCVNVKSWLLVTNYLQVVHWDCTGLVYTSVPVVMYVRLAA